MAVVGPAGGSGRPDYYGSFRAAPKPAKKRRSILDRLKKLGGTALDALTVPGAVVTTGVNAATGGDADWSDLGGAFTNKDGKGAGYKLLKRLGASDKWARIGGIAPEILLDPITYASGGLSAAAKLGGGASRLSKMAELAKLEETARKIVGPGAKGAVLTAKGLKGTAGLSPVAQAELLSVSKQANRIRRELETMGGVPAIRFGVGKKTVEVPQRHALHGQASVKVRVPRGVEVKLGKSARFAKDPFKGSKLRMSPVAKEFQRNRRVVTDLAAVSASVQKAAIAANNITPAELAYVREYVALKAQLVPKGAAQAQALGRTGPKQAASLRRQLIEDGVWRDELDALAEVYMKGDREMADVLGLVRYEDQLRTFGETMAATSAKVRNLDAARQADEAAALGAASAAKAQAGSAVTAQGAARLEALQPLLDEVDAAIGATTDPDRLKALRKQRTNLRRRVRAAERAASGLPSVRALGRIDATKDAALARIAERYAGAADEAWLEGATRFAEAARQGGWGRPWGISAKGAAPDLRALEAVAARLSTVEGHYTAGMSPDMMDAIRTYRAGQLSQGVREPHLKMAYDARGMDPTLERKFQSPVAWTTQTRYVDRLVEDGIPRDVANRMANMWTNLGAKFAQSDNLWEKTTVPLQPDVDFFRVQRQGLQGRQLEALGKYTEDLFRQLAPDADPDVIRSMMLDATARWEDVSKQLPTSMRKVFTAKRGPAAGESRFAIGTAWLKMWFTNFNPIGHYTLNATGSLLNSFIEGNRYHFTRGFIGAFGFSTRKLGKMNPAAMEKVYKVGNRDMTGLEALLMSSISGLGAPYARAEIAQVINMVDGAKESKPRWLARHLNNFQMDRESADRLYSFFNHIRGGDDIFTAGSKVVRYAFDYDQLTAFEKIWLRNLLIFYTWFRKNLVFQGYGLIARPGMYAAMAKVEQARPKAEGEPEWWAKAGGIGTPMGLLTFGNPYADIFKYSADVGDARRTVLSALNPFIKIPLEIAVDRNLFTGRPVGESTVDRLKHVGESVMGPQGKLVKDVVAGKDPVTIGGRILGPKIQRTTDEQNANRWAREQAELTPTDPAKSAAASKAADERRRRQLQRYLEATGRS